MMITTIKLSKDTKARLEKLNLADKGKSFDILVNDLITYYEESQRKYAKEWKRYQKDVEVWVRLIDWAKSKGFKG